MKLHNNHGIAVAFVMVGSIVGKDHDLGDVFFTPGLQDVCSFIL